MAIFEQVIDEIRELLGEDIDVSAASTLQSIGVARGVLVHNLEQHYGIFLKDPEYETIETVRDVVKCFELLTDTPSYLRTYHII